MTDSKDSDLLAYILAGFVIAISGIAVGVASTNPAASSRDGATDQAALVAPSPSPTPTPARRKRGARIEAALP
jgi:hypothetical protein